MLTPSKRFPITRFFPPLDHLFEEVEPAAILKARTSPSGVREFLVQWPDGRDDAWVGAGDVAPDVVADFDAGLEYAAAEQLLRDRARGDGREFLVHWADGAPDSWEAEENVAASLVAAYDAAKAERAAALAAGRGGGRALAGAGAGGGQG